jgi:hypothetical protein
MYEAAAGVWIPEGQTLDSMYQGDAMMNQAIEICGVDSLIAPPSNVWVTKDRQQIKVSDMTDAHLVNTIRYLRKLYGTQLDEEIEDIEESDTVPAFASMLEEAVRRGLQP